MAEDQKKKIEQNSTRSKRSSIGGEKSKRDTLNPGGKPKLVIPKLVGVEKLGLTGLVKDPADSQVHNEESKIDIP